MLARLPKKLIPYGIVLASWAYYLAYFNYGVTMNDEGYLIESVMRVVGGALPDRDFFADYGPLRFFYIAGWFEVLGPNWGVERIAFLFVRILTPLLLFFIARRFVSLRLALIPTVMVALVPGPWEKTLDSFLPIFNAWLLLLYLERPSWRRLVVCGASAGVAFFVKQDIGLGTMVAEALLLLFFGDARVITRATWRWTRARFGTLGVYVGGVLLGMAPILILYTGESALPGLFRSLWGAVEIEDTYGFSYFGLWQFLDPRHPKAFTEVVLVYLSLLTLVVFPLALWLKWRTEGKVSAKLVALWLIAGIAYPTTFYHPVYTRIVQTAPLGYVLATLLAVWLVVWLRGHSERRSYRIAARVAVAGFLMVPLVFLLFGFTDNDMYIGSAAVRFARNTLLASPRAPMYEMEEVAADIKPVLEYIAATTTAEDRIFTTYDHGFYFLTDRQNSTGVYFLPAHLDGHSEQRDEFLADLRLNPPKILIRRASELGDTSKNPAWWTDYVQTQFRPTFQNASYVVYDRVP